MFFYTTKMKRAWWNSSEKAGEGAGGGGAWAGLKAALWTLPAAQGHQDRGDSRQLERIQCGTVFSKAHRNPKSPKQLLKQPGQHHSTFPQCLAIATWNRSAPKAPCASRVPQPLLPCPGCRGGFIGRTAPGLSLSLKKGGLRG